MPLFNFVCNKCENEFEEYLLSWSFPNPKCPLCSGKSERSLGKAVCRMGNNIDTTPSDISTKNPGTAMRVPIISDRKSGATLGVGTPEVTKGK